MFSAPIVQPRRLPTCMLLQWLLPAIACAVVRWLGLSMSSSVRLFVRVVLHAAQDTGRRPHLEGNALRTPK